MTVGTAALIGPHQSANRTPSGIGGRFRVPGAASRGAPGPLRGRARSTQDAAPVQVRPDDPRRGDQVRVARDRAGQPIDVGRLEVGDLAEAMPMELAESHDVTGRLRERRGSWTTEVADPPLDRRPGRRRGARRLAIDDTAPQRRLPGQWHAARRVPGDLVARSVRGARVETARDGTRRLRARRSATPGGGTGDGAAPSRPPVAPSFRVSAAYASLISAICRVATRDAAGSSPVRSGWCARASRRQAALICVGDALASTPRTARGSRFTTAPVYRGAHVRPNA